MTLFTAPTAFAGTDVLATAGVWAANNFGDTREGALAGPLALAVIATLGVATVLLWRNMNARLRRLPSAFPDPRTTEQPDDQPKSPAPRGDAAAPGADEPRA